MLGVVGSEISWKGVAFYLVVVSSLLLLLALPLWNLPRAEPAAGLAALAMFTPAISALAVRLVPREGFGDAGLRFGSWRWYLLAWLLRVSMVAFDFG